MCKEITQFLSLEITRRFPDDIEPKEEIFSDERIKLCLKNFLNADEVDVLKNEVTEREIENGY